ncbi:hypothetical protein [Streptomyces sp. XY431]|nr:hypothetical protein [Streptomyces sp. XY431]
MVALRATAPDAVTLLSDHLVEPGCTGAEFSWVGVMERAGAHRIE